MQKHEFIPSVHSGYTVNFRVQIPDWSKPFLTNQKKFDKLLIFVNLYQYKKNEAVLSICSGEMVNLKFLQYDWLRAFWPIFQERYFLQRYDLYRNTANNVNFHYRTNSVKINDQIFL